MLVRTLAAIAALAVADTAAAAPTGSFTVQYDGYAHGLIALKLSASLILTPTAYSGRLAFRTAGMVSWVVHVDSDSTAQGTFVNGRAVPARFDSTGSKDGVDRQTHIHYADGSPVIESVTPLPEQERTPVPPDMTKHTIDTLSAIALLVRNVAETGRCEGGAMTFDGRRVTQLSAHTAGEEKLDASRKTHFNGQALRCDFDGNQLAGFTKNKNEAMLRKTRHGSAWLAPLIPGAPPVPVRVTFQNDQLGDVTLFLTDVSGGPGPVAQNVARSRMQ